MSMNLMFSNNEAESRAERDWKAINTVAEIDGIVWIEDSTADACARLLNGATLSNGERVCAFDNSDEEFEESLVCSFGPSLLDEQTREALRELLETDRTGGNKAAAMLDLIVELGLQVYVSGKDLVGARLVGVNSAADKVEINRCDNNMYAMLRQLGVTFDPTEEFGEVAFPIFEKAVNDNADFTDMPERLRAFIECARRNGASEVYWA
ncbi:MAG: hypothetical protein CL472_06800 [Acidobacteria bacterium]|nr:hypothetical protein [Acidobacteriota bacterium]